MDYETLPMTRWLDPRQIALVRSSFALVEPDAGWLAADFLCRVSATPADAEQRPAIDMPAQRRAFVGFLRAIVRSLDRPGQLRELLVDPARWPGDVVPAPQRFDALGNALTDALATWLGASFDAGTRAAWRALLALVAGILVRDAATAPASGPADRLAGASRACSDTPGRQRANREP